MSNTCTHIKRVDKFDGDVLHEGITVQTPEHCRRRSREKSEVYTGLEDATQNVYQLYTLTQASPALLSDIRNNTHFNTQPKYLKHKRNQLELADEGQDGKLT